jgi:hypothetical protein
MAQVPESVKLLHIERAEWFLTSQALTASLVRTTLFGPNLLPFPAVGSFSTQFDTSASRYLTMLLTFTYCGPSP